MLQALSLEKACSLREGVVQHFEPRLSSAMACFADDFEARQLEAIRQEFAEAHRQRHAPAVRPAEAKCPLLNFQQGQDSTQ